jgi:hypothetical protein
MNEENIKFEYYVMNDDFNKHHVEPFNIFRNHRVNAETVKAVKRYLRNPSKFSWSNPATNKIFYGFDAFVEELDTIIACEERVRCEYEIMVNGLFSDDDCAQKIDCYSQCKPNMAMIAREVIWQYKQQTKKERK